MIELFSSFASGDNIRIGDDLSATQHSLVVRRCWDGAHENVGNDRWLRRSSFQTHTELIESTNHCRILLLIYINGSKLTRAFSMHIVFLQTFPNQSTCITLDWICSYIKWEKWAALCIKAAEGCPFFLHLGGCQVNEPLGGLCILSCSFFAPSYFPVCKSMPAMFSSDKITRAAA